MTELSLKCSITSRRCHVRTKRQHQLNWEQPILNYSHSEVFVPGDRVCQKFMVLGSIFGIRKLDMLFAANIINFPQVGIINSLAISKGLWGTGRQEESCLVITKLARLHWKYIISASFASSIFFLPKLQIITNLTELVFVFIHSCAYK